MHILLILLVVVVVLGGLSLLDLLREHRQGRERSLQLRPLAKRLELSLDELPLAEVEALCERLLGSSRLERRAPLPKERADEEEPPAGLVLRGELDGQRLTLIDLASSEEGGLPTSVVVLEPASGALLRLILQRRSAAKPLAEILGEEQTARYEAIADFGGAPQAASGSAGQPPRALFGDDFLLEVHEEDLRQLRPLLVRGSMRELIEAHRDEALCVESLSGDRLLVHDLGRTLPGGEVERRLRETLQLAAALARPSA